ncbi:MAG: hypothetical protein FWD31_12290, partial [Planctomycetaceae bacterium]|nr:hypothetical protein [Planctomycetaceae bacterium]
MRILLPSAFVAAILLANTAIAQLPPPYGTGETINYPGYPLRTPQTEFNNGDLPATVNSLFSKTSWSGNIVTVTGSLGGHVYGGIASANNQSSNYNYVTITNGAVIGSSTAGGNVTGGWSWNHEAAYNIVDISNANVYNIVFGGWLRGGGEYATSDTVGVHNNRVIVGSGATLRDNVYGGYSQITGTEKGVSNNFIEIKDGSTVYKNGALVVGGYSALAPNKVSENIVT